MEWVQKYIHLFDGDSSQVTIWGISAGGGSVLNHVIAYGGALGTSLFRGAIANYSPYLPPVLPFNHELSECRYHRFVEEAGCDGKNDTFVCLVNSSPENLMRTNTVVSVSGPFGTSSWNPVRLFQCGGDC